MGLLVLKPLTRRRPLIPGAAWIFLCGVAWSLVWGLVVPTAQAAASDKIAIVANQLYPASSLTIEQVREIYLGRKTIEQFLRIRPIDQSDPIIRNTFLQRALDFSSKEAYIAYWNRLLFQKGGLPPLLKDSPDEVVKELIKTDGAIGYLWLENAQNRADLKILLVLPVR